MWTRPTIPWSIECEAAKPRGVTIDFLLNTEFEDGVLASNDIIAVLACLLSLLTILFWWVPLSTKTYCNKDKKKDVLVTSLFLSVPQTVLLLIIWLIAAVGTGKIDARLTQIEDLAFINGCSDKQTNIPLVSISADFTKADRLQYSIITMCIIMLIVRVLVSLYHIVMWFKNDKQRRANRP